MELKKISSMELIELHNVEDLKRIAPGSKILNRHRLPEDVRKRFSWVDSSWRESEFTLRFKEEGAPYLYGRLGTHHKVKPSDFSEDDRWFVEEAKKSAR